MEIGYYSSLVVTDGNMHPKYLRAMRSCHSSFVKEESDYKPFDLMKEMINPGKIKIK